MKHLLHRVPRTTFCFVCAFLLAAMALSLIARMAGVSSV